jgi:hypothetical protein
MIEPVRKYGAVSEIIMTFIFSTGGPGSLDFSQNLLSFRRQTYQLGLT